MAPPTHCSRCGRLLDTVKVSTGHDPTTGAPAYREHMRCPKKVTHSWQALLYGDHHDEFVVPAEKGPFPPGDPGPLLMEIKWR